MAGGDGEHDLEPGLSRLGGPPASDRCAVTGPSLPDAVELSKRVGQHQLLRDRQLGGEPPDPEPRPPLRPLPRLSSRAVARGRPLLPGTPSRSRKSARSWRSTTSCPAVGAIYDLLGRRQDGAEGQLGALRLQPGRQPGGLGQPEHGRAVPAVELGGRETTIWSSSPASRQRWHSSSAASPTPSSTTTSRTPTRTSSRPVVEREVIKQRRASRSAMSGRRTRMATSRSTRRGRSTPTTCPCRCPILGLPERSSARSISTTSRAGAATSRRTSTATRAPTRRSSSPWPSGIPTGGR